MAVPIPQNTTYGLTEQHAQVLNNICSSCLETKQLVEKMIRAGIDMEQAKKQNDMQHEIATNLKREFFPHLS